MSLLDLPNLRLIVVVIFLATISAAFPSCLAHPRALRDGVGVLVESGHYRPPDPPPGPLIDSSTKLVNDAAHPWQPAGPTEIRGPCPGLNTLASHGYLPRSGITTPAQIVNAVQEAFNMDNSIAIIVTYASFLTDGNPMSNLVSIGRKTVTTGDLPLPALVGGLNTHLNFEGDASITRADTYLGDNHAFDETLFEEFVDYCNRFDGGYYNLTAAAEFKWKRIQDSIRNNPNFTFVAPRYFTSYAESTFPINFFIDGRDTSGRLDVETARGFFQDGIATVASAHPIQPGRTFGTGNYVVDPTSPGLDDICRIYESFLDIVLEMYPKPTGLLRKALNTNLDYLFLGTQIANCTQVFPYGRDGLY